MSFVTPLRREKLRHVPLRLVLVVPFVLQIFAVVSLVGYLSFINGQQAVNDLAGQLIDKANQQVSQQLDHYMALPTQLVQMNADAIAQGEIDFANPSQSERYFWRQTKAFPSLSYIAFNRADGYAIGAGRWVRGMDLVLYENLPTGRAYDYSINEWGNRADLLQQYDYAPLEESWYQEAVDAQKLIWGEIEVSEITNLKLTATGQALSAGTGVLYESNHYAAVGTSAPVYDQNRKLLGVMSIDLMLSSVGHFLKNLQVSRSGQVFILERNGLLVATSSPHSILSTAEGDLRRLTVLESANPLIRAIGHKMQQFGNLDKIQAEQNFELTFGGQQQFVQVTPWRDSRGLDWLVVISVPESDFMQQINANSRMTILLCLVALAIATLSGIYTSHWIARPILRLTQTAKRLSMAAQEGFIHQEVRSPVTSSSVRELSILAHSFNHLARQLQETFGALERTNERLEQRVEERTLELRTAKGKTELAFKELQRAQSRLIQTEKMTSLGQLVAGIAHEINNPVSFISGNLNHAETYVKELLWLLKIYQGNDSNLIHSVKAEVNTVDLEFIKEDFPKLIDSMQAGAERIRQIVLALRSFSRLDEADCKAVDLHEGLESALMILDSRLKAENERPAIALHKHYGDLPKVECFAGQLNQVFLNILTNAIDAVTEAYQSDRSITPTITLKTTVADAQTVEVQIQDNGIGIPPEIQSRIFDPFFTTKPVGYGTGMGLATSYQIITEQHQGTLTCACNTTIGTCFTIQIPLKRSPV